jgi:Ca2+-binding EF-hand superfamily protein
MENLSMNKLEDLKMAFNLFDLDGDGFISKDELKEGLMIIYPDISDKDVNEIMDARSSTESINFENFVNMFADRKEYKTDDALFDAFKIFGKKNNGNITLEQMKYLVNTFMTNLTVEEKNLIINEFNRECDDSISFEAFVKILKLY